MNYKIQDKHSAPPTPSSSAPPLLERLKKAVADKRFNVFEQRGMQLDPKLALVAGAAIGYRMALDEITAKDDTEHGAEAGPP